MAEEMTALQKKWAEERAAQQEVEVKEEESLRPENMDQSVIDRIPKPTGWRIVVLPFRPWSICRCSHQHRRWRDPDTQRRRGPGNYCRPRRPSTHGLRRNYHA